MFHFIYRTPDLTDHVRNIKAASLFAACDIAREFCEMTQFEFRSVEQVHGT